MLQTFGHCLILPFRWDQGLSFMNECGDKASTKKRIQTEPQQNNDVTIARQLYGNNSGCLPRLNTIIKEE